MKRLALLLALLPLTLPGFAQTSKTATPPPPASSLAKVDAITDRLVDRLWTHTDHYWHDGDYNRIIALIRVVVEADPSFNEAYSSGAYLLWSMQENAAADTFLQYGINRTKEKGELYFELGSQMFRSKREKEAIPYLEKALALKYSHYPLYSVLGHAYRKQGMLENSLGVWKKAVEKFPKEVAAKTNYERVKKLVEEKR